MFTSKCASRHNGVHFFNISTSKSGANLVCFVHFHFEMCFAPQRRALFRHLNFQKRSDTEVFCTFSLGYVLRATTACNFSSFIWPANSAPAALASLTFRPSGAPNRWNNTVFRDFPTFSRSCIFFLLTLSLLLFSLLIFLFSLPLPYSAFHLSIFVGSLTSKLPSATTTTAAAAATATTTTTTPTTTTPPPTTTTTTTTPPPPATTTTTTTSTTAREEVRKLAGRG